MASQMRSARACFAGNALSLRLVTTLEATVEDIWRLIAVQAAKLNVGLPCPTAAALLPVMAGLVLGHPRLGLFSVLIVDAWRFDGHDRYVK